MAKRAPVNDTPYSPLDATLARSVMDGVASGTEEKELSDAIEAKPPEKSRKPKLSRAGNSNVLEHPGSSVPADLPKLKKRLNREKRVLLSAEEEREIERLVDRIGENLATSLKLSHLLRACMILLCHAEGELHAAATAHGPLIRPANGEAIALAQFEFNLAKVLSKALRDVPPIR
jgi:hypothetical protein